MRGLIRLLLLCELVFLALAERSASALDLVGYLPSYRMSASYNNNVLPTQLSMLNEVRYFGMTAASDGSILSSSGGSSLQADKGNIQTIATKISGLPAGQQPRLDLTLGGAGQSASFATIAASATLRTTFAQNIATLLTQTGATSVDIDWESPDNNNQTQLNNYSLMLQQIKQTVGASNRVYATIEPQINLPTSVLQGANAIDGISLMTYDISWWANDSADTNRGEHSLPQYVADTVDDWTSPAGSTNRRPYVFSKWGKAVDPADLGVGLPFYGHVIGTSQNPMGGTAYTYAQLVAGGTPDASGNYYTYAGQTVWLPGPSLAAQRVQFAHDHGLQNVFIWELGQDLDPTNPNSLLRAAFLKNETLMGDFNGDHEMDASDYDLWRSTFGSTTDLRADANGNGVVDSADYLIWRSHAASSGSGVSVGGEVPEPATISSVLFGSFILFAARRMR
jgi:GH18 family chitinase